MRRWAFGLVAVAAVAAAVVAFWPRGGGAPKGGEGASGGGDGSGDVPAGISGGDEAALGGGPGLAAGTRPGRVTGDTAPRGRATVFGVVRRDGVPAEATVELRTTDAEPRRADEVVAPASFYGRLYVVPEESPPAAVAAAGKDGRFAFDARGAGRYRLFALTRDGAKGWARVTVPADGARVEAGIAVTEAACALRGKVVYGDGSPWRGTVVVAPEGKAVAVPFIDGAVAVATDPDGRFAAAGLARGEVRASALIPGRAWIHGRLVMLPTSEDYVLTADAPGVKAEGRVLDAATGAPIAGAAVHANAGRGSSGSTGGSAWTATGPDGAFRMDLPGVAAADVSLLVAASGYLRAYDREPDLTKPLEIRLTRGATLEGRVLSAADGTPVAHAIVEVEAGGFERGVRRASSPTGADGRYSVPDLPAGEVTVRAFAPGWLPAASDAGRPTPTLEAGRTAVLDVRLVRGVRAAGRVLDSRDVPVPGAVVWFGPVDGDDTRPDWKRWNPDHAFLGTIATTAADGSFDLDGVGYVSPGRFYAMASGSLGGRSEPFEAIAGSPIDGVVIRLEAFREVVVTVLDETTGAPLFGARVALDRIEGRSGSDLPSGTTGRDGRALLGPVPAGALTTSVSLEEYVVQRGVDVPPDASALVVRLHRGLSITGRVLFPDGSPAASAWIDAIGLEGGSAYDSVLAGMDGAFRLSGLPEGLLTVGATGLRDDRGYSASSAVPAGANGVVLTLVPGAKPGPRSDVVVVRVLDPGGKPVPQVELFAFNSRSRAWSWGVDYYSGRGEVEGVREGDRVLVEAYHPLDEDDRPLPLGAVRFEGVVNPGEEIVLRLPPERTISGFVRDADGRPIPGVVVQATAPEPGNEGEDEDGDERRGDVHGEGTSVHDGSFRVGRLGAGRYFLDVEPIGDFLRPESVSVEAGTTGVVLVLRAGVGVVVHVLDPEGAPVFDATVGVGSGIRDARTDLRGAARLSGLDPHAVYPLLVEPPRGRSDLLPAFVRQWAPREETVRFGRAWVLRGVVRDPARNPVEGAGVTVRLPDGTRRVVSVGPGGRFAVEGLPMGDVVAWAHVGLGDPASRADADAHKGGRTGPETPASPGAADVVLALDPGATLVVVLDGWEDASRAGVSVFEERGTDLRFIGGYSEEHRPLFGEAGETSSRPLTLRGLDPAGTYALFANDGEDGAIAWRTGVRPTAEPVHLAPVPGKTISVRVKAPAAARHLEVFATMHGMSVYARDPAGGVRVVPCLLVGTWPVTATARVGDATWTATADVPAGGSVELELKPQAPR